MLTINADSCYNRTVKNRNNILLNAKVNLSVMIEDKVKEGQFIIKFDDRFDDCSVRLGIYHLPQAHRDTILNHLRNDLIDRGFYVDIDEYGKWNYISWYKDKTPIIDDNPFK